MVAQGPRAERVRRASTPEAGAFRLAPRLACETTGMSGEAGELRATSGDGTEVVCTVSGQGVPLLLIHGTGGSSRRWAHLLEPLGRTHSVLAMDRRGRGASGDGPGYSLENEIDDVVAVIDAIGEPACVFGHSFGGLLALEASLRTANIRALSLYEPPISVGPMPEEGIAALERILEDEGPEAMLVVYMLEGLKQPPKEVEYLRTRPEWGNRVAAAHTIPRELSALADYHFHQERFTNMRVKTQMMMGSESPQFLTASAKSVRMALPHGTLAVLDGQQHMAMDTAPDLFLQTLTDFVG
jgi:pimeloyl-ACP methyl ester carboxylesterase